MLTHSELQQQGEFRCTAKAIYKVTDEGRRLAHWDTTAIGHLNTDSPSASSTNLTVDRSSVEGSVDNGATDAKRSDAKIHRRISLAEKLNSNYDSPDKKTSKESNTDRLRYIVEEPGLRSLFREFLRGNFCEENLSFWVDVQDFKKKFNITSSAMAVSPVTRPGNRNTPGQAAMERHHESLINTAFVIYNTYLAPSSQCELNIDHGLRNELVKYLEEVVTNMTGKAFQGRVEPEQANAFNATQLQTMIRLYERIQTHVFRLMATDSVPKVSNFHDSRLFQSFNCIGFSSSKRRSSSRCVIGLRTSIQLRTIFISCQAELVHRHRRPVSQTKLAGRTSPSLSKAVNANTGYRLQTQRRAPPRQSSHKTARYVFSTDAITTAYLGRQYIDSLRI